ncbi:MAG TPA: peptidylprolyl isomerase [Gemmatimonadaceae bacterium]|nr:peptidylprolyl isomerase [Gemmatimonadaceae bacterium]
MRARPWFALATASLMFALGACDGLKEALTAHVDVAAKAANQELSVTRLADLLGNAKVPVPITKENAAIVADLWRNYQLVGHAAAVGDSLTDKKAIDQAVEPITKNMRLRKFTDTLVKSFKVDSGSEATYNQAAGELYAARHILFGFPPAATATQKDSVRKKAESVLPTVTNANFAQMAEKYSSDPSGKGKGGNLGIYEKESMVPPFATGVAALKPGQIGPSLVESTYGFHIVQRLSYDQIDKNEYAQKYSGASVNKADSVYLAGLDKSSNIEVKSGAPALAKSAVADPTKHHKDNTVLASFKGGDLTVGQFLGWVETMPPQMQISRQLPGLPDSVVKRFVSSIAQREVMLQKADSAKVTLSAEDKAQLYGQFSQLVQMLWQQLGVDPKMLADSAKTAPERERLAANRVESFVDRILGGQAQPVPVPAPLATVLQSKFESSINTAGVDRSVERAQKIRAAADSSRAANQPKSQVPLPGAPSGAAPTPTPQPTTPPAPAPKPTKKP